MANAQEIIAQAKLAKAAAAAEGTTAEERVYQEYKTARKATRMITDVGARIRFTNHTYLTDNEAIIEWLDAQIAARAIPGLSKGDTVTSSDLDPMAALEKELRAKIEQEYADAAKDKALGITRDMGTTDTTGSVKAGITSSKGTASAVS